MCGRDSSEYQEDLVEGRTVEWEEGLTPGRMYGFHVSSTV